MTNSLARWTGSVKPEARRRVGPVSGDVPSNEEYLRWLVDSLAQTHVVVEFRHTRWLTDQTMDFLCKLKAGVLYRGYAAGPESAVQAIWK